MIEGRPRGAAWEVPSVVLFGGAAFASLVGAWLVTHGHATRALALGAAIPIGLLVIGRPQRALLLAIALIVLVPYWLTVGAAQASIGRLAPLLALGAMALGASEARLRVKAVRADLAVAAVCGIAFASWAVEAEPRSQTSLRLVVNFVLPLAFYAAGRRFGRTGWEKLIWALLAAATLASLSVYYELLVAHRPVFIDQASYYWNARLGRVFRPGGVFGSPPAAGAVLSMCALAGLAVVSRSSGMRRRLAWTCVCLCGGAVIVTFTRASMFGLAAGLVFWGASLRSAHRARLVWSGVTVMLLFSLFVLPRIEQAAWFQNGVLRQGTLAARQSYWAEAWPIITNSPQHLLFGHGVNSLLVTKGALQAEPQSDLLATPTLYTVGPHNQYFRTLLDEGLLGLVALLAWLGGALYRSVRARRSAENLRGVTVACGAATLSFAVIALAGDALRDPPTAAVVALLTGILVSCAGELRASRAPAVET